MITKRIAQNDAQELYEKLSTLLEVIDEDEQAQLYCANWNESAGILGKCCSHHCPMAHADGACAIDEARALIRRLEH